METVLIFRIGSIGDTVVALPCFHKIAQSFASAHRIVITDAPVSQKVSSVEGVIGGTGLFDDVIYFPAPPRRLKELLKLRREIKATGAKTLIYVADRTLPFVLRDLLFFYCSGIRRIIGAPLSQDLQKLRIDPSTGATEREAERLARCLAPLGTIELSNSAAWDLKLQPQEIETARKALAALRGRDFLAVSLGGKFKEKDWGDANWSVLIKQIAVRHPLLSMVFFGSADEAARCASFMAELSGECVNLCGVLSPRESAAAISRGLFYLGHDCGPMHLAGAVGIPCIALFGAINMPKWWYPMGEQHHILHDMNGVRNITPAAVIEAVDAMIQRVRGHAGWQRTESDASGRLVQF